MSVIDAAAVAQYDQLVAAFQAVEDDVAEKLDAFRKAPAPALAERAAAKAAKIERDKLFEKADAFWRENWLVPTAAIGAAVAVGPTENQAEIMAQRPERVEPRSFPKAR